MAARSKKRLSKIENKLLNINNLQLKDVVCSICQSILIEPVTLPCYHYFCQRCFNGSIENNALCCPLCRLRIGSWLRSATKQKNIVNIELWDFIQTKFSNEITTKLRGDDVNLPQETPILRLSAPGEIRSEYEAELNRLRSEQNQLEQKHYFETQMLIQKIQEEEKETQMREIERLKEDENLAKTIVKQQLTTATAPKYENSKLKVVKPRLKSTKMDVYLTRPRVPLIKDSPLLTDDNTSSDASTPKVAASKPNNSPEMVPSYGKLLKNFLDKKLKTGSNLWNKENGNNEKKTDEPQPKLGEVKKSDEKLQRKLKNGVNSLLVSLPLPSSGIPQVVLNKSNNRNLQTGSIDSMHQELCYFKPIEKTSTISANLTKGLPVRVPCVRVVPEHRMQPDHRMDPEEPPSREQFLNGLCRLRNISLAHNLPSAFVVALSILRAKKDFSTKDTSPPKNSKMKRTATCTIETAAEIKKQALNKLKNKTNHSNKICKKKNLRRTRSMGSLKDENETTPKKAKIQERKVTSERKPHLRSDSKKIDAEKILNNTSEDLIERKVNLAVKNLSSPLKNCDVKIILQEQLRIEKIIEQEKSDLELARKMDAELNGRRLLRGAAVKRQVTLNYALRPSKKLKV